MNWILFIILHYVSVFFFIFIFKKKNGYPRKAYYYYRYYYYFRKKNVDLKEGMNEKHPSNIDNSFFVLLLFCLCKMRHWRILSNKQCDTILQWKRISFFLAHQNHPGISIQFKQTKQTENKHSSKINRIMKTSFEQPKKKKIVTHNEYHNIIIFFLSLFTQK